MIRYIVFAALFFVASISSADQSSARPKKQPPQPVVVQSPVSVQFDHGTEQNPMVITGNVSTTKTDEEKAAETKKAQDDHELTVATAWLAGSTVVLGVAAVATGILTLWSIRLTKQAAEVLPKLERAYLFVTVELGGFSGREDNNVEMRIKIRFHNYGKTPAILKSLRYYTVYDDKTPDSLVQHENADRELPQGLVIGANKEWERTTPHKLNKEELAAIRDVVQHVYAVGQMKYEDVIGGKHEVSFCWMSEPRARIHKPEFTICPSPLNKFT
jgi:hypothetical protein